MTTADTHPVPDQHGANLFDTDPDLGRLLPLYLPAPSCSRTCCRTCAGWAGWPAACSTTLAQTADKHPPTLQHRTRSGVDAQRIVKHPAYVELERVAFGEYGLAAMSHRGGVLGWHAAAAAGRQVRADLPVRAGRVRPVLPAVDDRFADAHAAQVRRRRSWSSATCRG